MGLGRQRAGGAAGPRLQRPLQQSAPAQLRRISSEPSGHEPGVSARRGPVASPEGRRLADRAKRQYAAGARRRSRKNLDDGGIRHGNAPSRPCQKADVRGAQSPGRAMGRRVPQALSAGPLVQCRAGAFRGGRLENTFVAEADLYKNLFYTTKMNRIAGLPNSESNRALDMYIKTRYVREINSGRGVVFATGTPISNTMAEMYTMLRYLAPDLLKERGVAHFDAWAANFAEAVTALELAPDGSGYRMHTRFAKFINLPELLSMVRTFADVQTADMLNLPRPGMAGGKPYIVAASASVLLKEFIKTLTERAERLRTARGDPSVDNMLKITGEGRKAALDMRLVDSLAEPEPDTKLSLAVDRIRKVWTDTSSARSTQLVFCDLSTPDRSPGKAGRGNVYDEVRAKRSEAGGPQAESAGS